MADLVFWDSPAKDEYPVTVETSKRSDDQNQPRYHHATAREASALEVPKGPKSYHSKLKLHGAMLEAKNKWLRTKDLVEYLMSHSGPEAPNGFSSTIGRWLILKSMIEYQRSIIHDIDSFATIRNRVSASGILAGENAHLLLYNFRSRLMVKQHILRQAIGRLSGVVGFQQSCPIYNRATSTKWDEINGNLDYIINWIDRMVRRRETELNTVLAKTQLEESRKAIKQGDTVKHLTTLAFLYIPVSCVASIFGMNVAELDPGPPVWMFVVAATCITILTIVVSLQRSRTAAVRLKHSISNAVKAGFRGKKAEDVPPSSPQLPPMYW